MRKHIVESKIIISHFETKVNSLRIKARKLSGGFKCKTEWKSRMPL